MRQLFSLSLVGLLCLVLTGCGPSDSAIVGKWVLDVDATKAAIRASKASEDEKKIGEEMIGMMGAMFAVEFKADKTVTMMGQTAKWSLEGSNVVVDNNGKKSKAEYRGGLLYLQMEEGDKEKSQIVLKKA